MICTNKREQDTAAPAKGLWQDPIFVTFLVFLAMVAVLYVFAKSLLVLFFITTLLFILLDPLVNRLEGRLPRSGAVIAVLAGFFGFFIVLMTLVFGTLLPDLAGFVREFPAFAASFDSAMLLSSLPPDMAEYGAKLLHDAAGFSVNLLKDSLVPLLRTFSGVAEMIAVPFLTFYLLQDGRRIAKAIADFLPSEQVERFSPFMQDVGMVLSGYIRGQMLISLLSGTTVFIAMTLLGLPFAHILAVVAALSEFVPVIGSVIATVPSALLSLSFSWVLALKVIVFYIILLKVNHNIIYPKVVGQAIKVHPVFIMATVLIFGHLFGVIGMLFAVPAVAVTRVWILHVWGRR